MIEINYLKVLRIFALTSLLFFIISLGEIAKNNITGFQPLIYGFGFIFYGAFNWADMAVFSLLWLILSLILTKLKKRAYFWLAFFSFWLIRSNGEVVFSFLQQFHPETKPWLLYLPRAFLQNSFLGNFILVRYWVVEQIFFQSISVLSLFGLIYTLVKIFGKDKNLK